MNNVVTKILIAEDEPTLVLTLKYNLEREGYAVLSATDGEAAIATARKTRPDLIVLDVIMPGLNGLEVCRILRKEMHVPSSSSARAPTRRTRPPVSKPLPTTT